MPCQSALSAAMLASDELVAVSVELPYRSESSWLVGESEASVSACSIAALPVLAPDEVDPDAAVSSVAVVGSACAETFWAAGAVTQSLIAPMVPMDMASASGRSTGRVSRPVVGGRMSVLRAAGQTPASVRHHWPRSPS